MQKQKIRIQQLETYANSTQEPSAKPSPSQSETRYITQINNGSDRVM